MFARPAFLDRILSRLPDVRALRFSVTLASALASGAFGLLLVLCAVHLDARRCAEVARAQAETLAHTAGAWLDGDSHAGLGQDPEKRLSDSAAVLRKLLEASDSPAVVRTLRPKATDKAALAAKPDAARAGALEVVLQTGVSGASPDVDYRPEMRAALFDGKSASRVARGRVSAYAPVPDSWGASPAIVWVDAPASAPLWRRLVFALGATLFAGLLVSFAVWQARRAAEALALQVGTLDSGVRQLAAGRLPGPFGLGRSAPSELTALAESLESLRGRLHAQASGQPLPAEAPTEENAEQAAQQTALGEASEFDLALLMQQLVEPARKQAQARRVDVQLVFPDGVPSQVVGYPMALFRALEALLRRALRVTGQGRISLRVSRVGEGPEGGKLRFEVTDTSPGIAFKDQPELCEALARAAGTDPESQQDPLHLASALAHALGGELGFESQPGQGSRFGFSASFRVTAPHAQTAFQPNLAAGFPARAAGGAPPHPISAFVPRQTLRAR
jgi:hypothetical protein